MTTKQLEAINTAIQALAKAREEKYCNSDYKGADYIQSQIAILMLMANEHEAVPSAFDDIDFNNINL